MEAHYKNYIEEFQKTFQVDSAGQLNVEYDNYETAERFLSRNMLIIKSVTNVNDQNFLFSLNPDNRRISMSPQNWIRFRYFFSHALVTYESCCRALEITPKQEYINPSE